LKIERHFAKVEVASSNLVSRSKKNAGPVIGSGLFLFVFRLLKKFFPSFSPLFSSYSFLFKVGRLSNCAQIVP